jgi:hypothetical protein
MENLILRMLYSYGQTAAQQQLIQKGYRLSDVSCNSQKNFGYTEYIPIDW